MATLVKFILVLLGLAYLISPADLIPEMYLPLVGWIDDSLVMVCLYHLIRYGRLPSFFYLKKGGKQSFGKNDKGPEPTETFKQGAQNQSSYRSNTTGKSTKGEKSAKPVPLNPHMIFLVWTALHPGLTFKLHIKTRPSNTTRTNSPTWVKTFQPLPMKKFLEIQQAYAELKSIYNR
jgi:Uncharacterized conserved protein